MMNLEGMESAFGLNMPNSLERTEQKGTNGSFEQFLNVIENVNEAQVSANTLMSDVILGKSEDTHGAMIALEKASIQMELMVKVRDQLTEGYNKLINIQI